MNDCSLNIQNTCALGRKEAWEDSSELDVEVVVEILVPAPWSLVSLGCVLALLLLTAPLFSSED